LVDILISYLERSTAYLRVIANQVFALLTSLVEKSTIDLVLTVSNVVESKWVER